jgi:hypothetical protein
MLDAVGIVVLDRPPRGVDRAAVPSKHCALVGQVRQGKTLWAGRSRWESTRPTFVRWMPSRPRSSNGRRPRTETRRSLSSLVSRGFRSKNASSSTRPSALWPPKSILSFASCSPKKPCGACGRCPSQPASEPKAGRPASAPCAPSARRSRSCLGRVPSRPDVPEVGGKHSSSPIRCSSRCPGRSIVPSRRLRCELRAAPSQQCLLRTLESLAGLLKLVNGQDKLVPSHGGVH